MPKHLPILTVDDLCALVTVAVIVADTQTPQAITAEFRRLWVEINTDKEQDKK